MIKKENIKWIFLVIGCISYIFLNGELNIGISAWVWTFSILFFYRRSEKRWMRILVFILTILISALKWYGMVDGPFYLKFICGIVLGICFFIPYFIDHHFYNKVNGFKVTLIFPLSFATIEFLMSTMPMGELESLAATQTDYTSLIQLASLVGTYGISVIVSWLASTVIYIADYVRDNKKIPHKAAFTYLSVLIVVLFIGGLRVATPLKDVKTIKVAVSTGIENGTALTANKDFPVEDHIKSMNKSITKSRTGGADIIVFNEEAFTVMNTDLDKLLSEAKKQAKAKNIFVILPVEIEYEDENTLSENCLYIIDNHGKELYKYTKTKLVPLFETDEYVVGDGNVPNLNVTLPSGNKIKLATVICMDSNFTWFIRSKVDNDTELLIVPTWDWKPIDKFHNNWTLYRSIENGFTIVRSTYDGYSAVFGPYGQTYGLSHTDYSGFENVIIYETPVKQRFTIYKYIGPIIDWMYPLALVLLLISPKIKMKKK